MLIVATVMTHILCIYSVTLIAHDSVDLIACDIVHIVVRQ